MKDSPRFGGFVPYLHYEDAASIMDWYARVFGFEERARFPDEAVIVS